MSTDITHNIDVVPETVEVTGTLSGDTITAPDHCVEMEFRDSIVTGSKNEYSIVGDALYASVNTADAPAWLTNLIDNITDNKLAAGFTDYDSLVTDVRNAISSIDIASNNYVTQVQYSADQSGIVNSVVTQLNATYDLAGTQATITNLDVAIANELQAQGLTVADITTAYQNYTNGQITNINQSLSTAIGSNTSSINALTTVYEDPNTGILATANATQVLNTYVGLDPNGVPDGTGLLADVTARAAWAVDLDAYLGGNNGGGSWGGETSLTSNIETTSKGEIKAAFEYDAKLFSKTGQYYKSGFGLNASTTGGTGTEVNPFTSEFWIDAERLVLKSPTYNTSAAFTVGPSGIVLGLANTEATRNVIRGTWSSGTPYLTGDIVSFGGSTYMAKAASTGIAVTNTAYWDLMAEAGADGTSGTDGARGTAVFTYSANLGATTPAGAVTNIAAYWDAAASTAYDNEIAGDTLIVTNTSTSAGWTHIYEYTGSAWTAANTFTVNGNQVVTGTLSAAAIGTGSLISTNSDAYGPLFSLDMNGGAVFRGIEIRDSSNNIVMASGASIDYTAVGGTKPPSNATYGATFGSNISGQITAASASTYIASAAIGNAQIGNAAITNAKIGTAAVDTLQLAGQSVTIPVSVYTAGSIGINDNWAWTTVQTLSFTSSGNPVTLFVSGEYYAGFNSGSQQGVAMRILRNGAEIYRGTMLTSSGDPAGIRMVHLSETPGAGTITYTWQATTTYYSDPGAVHKRAMTVLEVKR